MLVGLILFTLGILVILKNRALAVKLGADERLHQSIGDSVARQNVAVIGAVLAATGIGLMIIP